MKNITKSYPGVVAVNDVSFDLKHGEIHGLIGANGAGKSTLVKIMYGVEKQDEGEILINGKKADFRNPVDAISMGVSYVPQEVTLAPTLNVAQNIFLNREVVASGVYIKDKYMEREAKKILDGLSLDINVKAQVDSLKVSDKQMVAIANAISRNSEIMIFDEPTAALNENEIVHLFNTITNLAKSGVGIIFISHRLDEIFQLCDRTTIMRDGFSKGTYKKEEINKEAAINIMIGRDLEMKEQDRFISLEKPVLTLENLGVANSFSDANLTLNEGEIFGLFGQVGSGRTELLQMIFGAVKADQGKILIDNNEVKINSPIDAIKHNIGFVTEERKTQGLILLLNIEDNVSLGNWKKVEKIFFIDKTLKSKTAKEFIKNLQIITTSSKQLVNNLSGGNQQKVVLARWLNHSTRILLLDEPTKGIDVGAKEQLYQLFDELSKEGISIIMASSELEEIRRCCHRTAILKDKKIQKIVNLDQISDNEILSLAM
jgi:ABC-type sugar transport system ATPase subunit